MTKLLIFVLAISIISISCNSQKQDNTVSNTDDQTVKIYQNNCAGCHGANLERFVQKDWMYGESQDAVFKSIKFGQVDIGMPGFGKTLDDEEIAALTKYVINAVPKQDKKQSKVVSKIFHDTEELSFKVDTIVTGLDVPWGLEFLPNGDLLISERSGTLYRYSNNKLIEISGLPPILAKGQGGLLDLKLHPDYSENGWIYIAFSDLKSGEGRNRIGCTSILRAKLKNDKLIETEKIFTGEPASNKGQHWGCKLDFDSENRLYFGIGDRGARDVNPQSLANHSGKILRINDDGSIPEDNPFVNTEGAMPSIYSYGHRNPQGTSVHPETGEVWVSEHGPKGGDELNLIKPGKNYGWPIISYGINYNGTRFTDITQKEGMVQPQTYWVPSIAPCGMTFVKGNRYPGWENNLLIGSLRFKYLERVVLYNHHVIHKEKLLPEIGRVRNVVMSPDGFVYVAIEQPGKIVKLIPVDE